jgi:hypothetical protein
MLNGKSISFAIAAALIAFAPASFAQTAAPYGSMGTFGAAPGIGAAPLSGTPPTVAIPSVGSAIGTAPGTFGAAPGAGPAPITGSTPSPSRPAGMSPDLLGVAPTSPGVIGGGPMGYCVPGSIGNPC